MNIKIWSLVLATLIPSIVAEEKNEDIYLGSNWIDADFSDIETVQQWSQLTDEYIKNVKENNTDTVSRSVKFGIVDVIAPIFSKVKAEATCVACDFLMNAVHKLTYVPFTHNWLLKGFTAGCKLAGRPDIECEGYVKSYGEEYLDVIHKMDFDKEYIGKLACFHLARVCPHPEIPDAEWSLPAPKKVAAPQPSGKELKILHLSDFHYDSTYVEGSESDCRRSICCHKDSHKDEKNPNVIKKPASKWGEYKCDMPLATLESMLQHIGQMNSKEKFDMLLFTGDIPAHDAFRETKEHSKATEHAAYNLLQKYIDPKSTKFYPVIGNHESVPSNLFPELGSEKQKGYDLYDFIAGEWQGWLPENALSTIKKAGYYSMNHSDKLKVIVLNNNLCYSYNAWVLLDPENSDPSGMLAWAVNELKDAESKGQKVYIASHVPPANADCHQKFSRSWNKIVKAYSHVLISQFYGHTHHDEFEMYYLDGPKNSQNAISHSFIAPSITTHVKMNPGFRVYTVDAENYQIKDFTQYYANLAEKESWTNGPVWKKLYSAKEAFQVPSARGPYINATFWHEVTELFERDNAAFESYKSFRFKGTGLHPTCDGDCKKDTICNLRASNAREVCNWGLDFDY